MSKVIDILKQNSDLKKQLNEVITIVRENDIKSWGYKAIEYTFLNATSLRSIDKGPLLYLEEVFSIDKAYLLINIERFPSLLNKGKYSRIIFYNRKAFDYFFFAKKPFTGQGTYNLTKEFDLVEGTKSYLIIPILREDKIVASLNFYSYNEDKFNENFAVDFAKDLAIKIGYILFNLNKTRKIQKKLRECMIEGCNGLVNETTICPLWADKVNNQYVPLFIKFTFHEKYYFNMKRNFLIIENIYKLLSKVNYVDHIIKPYSDLIIIYTSENIVNKINLLIKTLSDTLDYYLREKKIDGVFFEIKKEGKYE
jgi:hypothetical protein